MASKIEWTQETWNPITGCSKISAGCKNCYAETMARRLKAMGQPAYQDVIGDNGKWNGNIHFVEDALEKPLKRKKPTMYFVNSMSDMFHENAPFEMADEVWRIMAECPQHTFQVLTKRAKRMYDYLKGKEPLPNVWLGVSAEDQSALETRAYWLIRTPAVIRFLSCEPLLGRLSLDLVDGVFYDAGVPFPWQRVRGIDWVIVGGESGPGARPCNPNWVRSIRTQCQLAGVPFFFKQWGGKNKKAAGNLLDGEKWEQYPQ